jgi:hypothetical protein
MTFFETGANVGLRSYKALTDTSLARMMARFGIGPPKIEAMPQEALALAKPGKPCQNPRRQPNQL